MKKSRSISPLDGRIDSAIICIRPLVIDWIAAHKAGDVAKMKELYARQAKLLRGLVDDAMAGRLGT